MSLGAQTKTSQTVMFDDIMEAALGMWDNRF